jgi:hypothetical protein
VYVSKADEKLNGLPVNASSVCAAAAVRSRMLRSFVNGELVRDGGGQEVLSSKP